MVDIAKLKSHPDKLLFTHTNGVIENVKKLTEGLSVSRLAELAAIFHDLGKINPNFQDKLNKVHCLGYSNHAYLSAYAFFVFCSDASNIEIIKGFLNGKDYRNEAIAAIILIAKHHGHLPDFCPKSKSSLEVDPYILNRNEVKNLYCFLPKGIDSLPVDEFVSKSFEKLALKKFKLLLNNEKVKAHFLNKVMFNPKNTEQHLDFFLNTQFSFAALIHADKTDAMDSSIIKEDKERIKKFCEIYAATLAKYISKFTPDTELNKSRTQIRKESIKSILPLLKIGKRVFELTAPTGSGKTIMLLSLASEIIKMKGNYRIMYALPFLSITEQVEKEVLEIFKDFKNDNFIQRIDSKSNNCEFEKVQKELDANPSAEKIKELDFLAFREQVFAYPFVITTFVQFFETLLSNHNGTLLKLPNFSKSIFLLDEIQSLPPRLYTFFVAYLTKFCEKFDCYAIISTATQPNYELPNGKSIKSFFGGYEQPAKLLEHQKYFENDVFNRYQINYWHKEIDIEQLTEKVLAENNSVLVILNTIDDSKELFKKIKESGYVEEEELYLLNTHFTPNDRKKKIKIIKDRLKSNKRTILVSTQLIEAGVDIDFPVLYRDFALVSSIVQSAGRCNRNGKLEFLGKVVLFKLIKQGKLRANLIYGQGKDKDILGFTKKALGLETTFQEKELLDVQQDFFDEIATKLNFAEHSQKKFRLEFDFLEDIKECAFKKIGRFQLIDEEEYGEQMQFYIPTDNDDRNFETLLELNQQAIELVIAHQKNWEKIKQLKYKMQNLLKIMSNQIVSVRLRNKDTKPILASSEAFNEVLYNAALESYSFENGIKIAGEGFVV